MPEITEKEKKIAREAEEWASRQKLLQMSEISLIIDTYDDIFSDFDPRPLDHRTLSDDFLLEIRRASKEKTMGVIEINFLIPAEQRKADKEAMIRRRLHEYFHHHYEQTKTAVNAVKQRGVTMIAVGVLLSVIAAVFFYPTEEHNVLFSIMLVLLEPAAWFTIWEGANKVSDTWHVFEPDLVFYQKMSKSEINFTGY